MDPNKTPKRPTTENTNRPQTTKKRPLETMEQQPPKVPKSKGVRWNPVLEYIRYVPCSLPEDRTPDISAYTRSDNYFDAMEEFIGIVENDQYEAFINGVKKKLEDLGGDDIVGRYEEQGGSNPENDKNLLSSLYNKMVNVLPSKEIMNITYKEIGPLFKEYLEGLGELTQEDKQKIKTLREGQCISPSPINNYVDLFEFIRRKPQLLEKNQMGRSRRRRSHSRRQRRSQRRKSRSRRPRRSRRQRRFGTIKSIIDRGHHSQLGDIEEKVGLGELPRNAEYNTMMDFYEKYPNSTGNIQEYLYKYAETLNPKQTNVLNKLIEKKSVKFDPEVKK